MNECPNVFALFLFMVSERSGVLGNGRFPKTAVQHMTHKSHLCFYDELVIKMLFIMLTPVRLIARIALNFYQNFR